MLSKCHIYVLYAQAKSKSLLKFIKSISLSIVLILLIFGWNQSSEPNEVSERDQKLESVPSLSSETQMQLLLISSDGRSGSTWVGQLLSALPMSFYVGEPMHNFVKARTDADAADKVVSGIFTCSLPGGIFSSWKKAVFCPQGCTRNEACSRAKVIIVKIIRMRFRNLFKILSNPSVSNVKVIVLIRDPRAQRSSANLLSWEVTHEMFCSNLRQDVQALSELVKRYPNRIFFMRYEELCQEPYNKTEELWQFLRSYKKVTLPEELRTFHDFHLQENARRQSHRSTWRNTSQEWQNWRQEITKEVFYKTQELCGDAIDKLGYIRLNDFKDVTNVSVPTLTQPHILY